MFVSKRIFNLLIEAQDNVYDLRSELKTKEEAIVTLERELASVRANFNWLTTRVNALELERALLLEKVTGVKTAVPEIARTVPTNSIEQLLNSDIFTDMGDEKARALGLPTYS